ncbi:MAG: hypothetical protein KY476_21835 [Planctomycetes bacterium]|nr:hypothetical protein [Planctomycetota bacterium]
MNPDLSSQDAPANDSFSAAHASPPAGDSPYQPDAHAPAAASFSIRRVLLTVLAVVLVGGAGAAGWWYWTTREPALYPVKGIVYLDGEPMQGGIVTTQYLSDPQLRGAGALAAIDERGRFELVTNYRPEPAKGEYPR